MHVCTCVHVLLLSILQSAWGPSSQSGNVGRPIHREVLHVSSGRRIAQSTSTELATLEWWVRQEQYYINSSEHLRALYCSACHMWHFCFGWVTVGWSEVCYSRQRWPLLPRPPASSWWVCCLYVWLYVAPQARGVMSLWSCIYLHLTVHTSSIHYNHCVLHMHVLNSILHVYV